MTMLAEICHSEDWKRQWRLRCQAGVALLEVLVSVVVLSIGTLGLVSSQIAAKRVGYEALQRTTASLLATDIIERMRGNASALSHYGGASAGVVSNVNDSSGAVCSSACESGKVAARDLRDWERAILGFQETDPNGVAVGGLHQASGCVAVEGGSVEVTISWSGHREMSSIAASNTCGANQASAYRQLLALTTFITGDI